MTIRINGEPREVPFQVTVAKLVEELKLNARFLAVERNGELIPRSEHANCVLVEGDDVEIVTLVGGG